FDQRERGVMLQEEKRQSRNRARNNGYKEELAKLIHTTSVAGEAIGMPGVVRRIMDAHNWRKADDIDYRQAHSDR
ncbi:MAG TPA: hypothetical protein VMB03_00385, partial [Bryobacteraceae bacterium]|nr:hypothetical protein [Bryobacteraceae bacterium]